MIKLYGIRDMKYTSRELFLSCTGIMIGILMHSAFSGSGLTLALILITIIIVYIDTLEEKR